MALSVEKLLTDAHSLTLRLKDKDSMADNVIALSQALYLKVEAMKQYQDDITELNEIAKHRPRSTLVLGIAQENRQIRELQQENRELQATLEDHQSALELIMQKYREHTVKLLHSSRMERALQENEMTDKNSMCHLMDKIDEMAGVMQKAIEVDETTGCADKERLSQLEVENRALRELLEICSTSKERIVPLEVSSSGEIMETSAASVIEVTNHKVSEESEDDGGDDTVNEASEDESDSSELNTTIEAAPTPTPTPPKKGSEEAPDKKSGASPAVKKSPERNLSGKESKEKEKDSTGNTTPAAKSGKAGAGAKADVKKGKGGTTSAAGGASTLKKASSSPAVKRDNATVRKSPSVDSKKDLKGKAGPTKPAAGKK